MKVEVTYFKRTGKYYTTVEHEVEASDAYAAYREVEELMRSGRPPGLHETPGRPREFNAVVTAGCVPHLVLG